MIYKVDYWGFVYLWRDRRNGWFCVGSHYGALDDRYVSSTGNFKKAYKNRPVDFKRKILYVLKEADYPALVAAENYWLAMIRPEEFSSVENHRNGTSRYYNCKGYAIGGAWNKGKTAVQCYDKKRCPHCLRMFSAGMFAYWHGDWCLENPNRLDRASRARKKRTKQPAYVANNVNSLPLAVCDACGIRTTKGNLIRWHGARCQPRKYRTDVKARQATTFEIRLAG